MYVFDCIEWHQLYVKTFQVVVTVCYYCSYHSLLDSDYYCLWQFPSYFLCIIFVLSVRSFILNVYISACVFFFFSPLFVGLRINATYQIPFTTQKFQFFILSRIVFIVATNEFVFMCTTFRITHHDDIDMTLLRSRQQQHRLFSLLFLLSLLPEPKRSVLTALFVLPIWMEKLGPVSAFCHIIFYIVMEWVFCLHK